MIYIDKDTQMTTQLLSKMIQHFCTCVRPKLQKYKDYYDGNQAILSKTYKDKSKPISRVVTNYCMNIANSYDGYIATPGYISYQSDNNIEPIMDVLRYNDYQAQDADFLLDALVYGTAAELMYSDAEGKTRFALVNPTQCFGIFDDSLTGDLLYFVRMYKESEWDDSDTMLVDVYSNYFVQHYKMNGVGGGLEWLGEEKHYFNQCPANIFYLQDEKSIFDCIMTLQDAVNETLSSEIDDYSAWCDSYLTLTGADVDSEDIGTMKENRVLVLPEGATANWLTKQANDVQVENILKRLHDNIYRIAQCPDFSSETFVGGVSSGIALQFRLCGMENRAGMIEGRMKKALQRRIEIITGVAALMMGEEVFRDIDIDFKRNIPEDTTNTINMVNALKGTVSDATLLSQIPFVTDVNAELQAVNKQKKANMELYSFDIAEDDNNDEY